MKIVFFSRFFYPHIGGVEKHVLEISKRLVKKGYEVIVVTEELTSENSSQRLNVLKHLNKGEEVQKIKIVRIQVGRNDWFKKFRIWRELWKYRSLINNADVIHCHDVFYWYLPFRFLSPTKKVFTTFHGYEGNKIPGKRAIIMHKIAEVLSFGNICVGDFLKKWYGTTATYVTYGAVKVQSSTLRFHSGQEFKILYIGRLEEEAGILQYLKALKILSEKFNFEVTVLGDGSLRKEAGEFCKRNNLKVDFKGFVKNVESYLPKADYVFTSRYLGILEAMAAKKPVLAHYNNSIKKDYLEMSPFAKWIVIDHSPDKLAEKFNDSLQNKEKREENINKAYDWVKNQTWEEVLNTYEKLWKLT
ncbi:MAG: glycosyltransferase family 4 protein [Candidatus Levybacteria bacterium]|nr:glycosyltransferase family 4 protein [Candidatus Levybacteria bacterium]